MLARAKRNTGTTADDVHAYLGQLRGYAGVNGIYDFRTNVQRGLGQNADIVTVWDPEKKTFVPAAKPGGYR